MENLAVAIALYVLIIAVAYCPNKTTATDPVAAPVQYFPEVEQITDPDLSPVVMPVQAAIAITPPKPAKAILSTLIKEELSKPAIASSALSPVTVADDLATLPICALYAGAKGKVKGYKSMTKSCLIEALST